VRVSLWNQALDLLYPPRCPGCGLLGTRASRFCAACAADIRPPASPLCSICGDPFAGSGPDHLCHRCLTRRPAFGFARACSTYAAAEVCSGPLRQALQRYKYGPDVSLAPALAKVLTEHASMVLSVNTYDLIMPVPLHISRLRWRGFNQALLLARELARQQRVPIDPFVLERVRATAPQVELDDAARRRNVARAFRVVDPARIRGRRVLLVDDVYTTGATANECSRTLLRAGAAHVDVLVLSRAVLR
jgi:ComF family protein